MIISVISLICANCQALDCHLALIHLIVIWRRQRSCKSHSMKSKLSAKQMINHQTDQNVIIGLSKSLEWDWVWNVVGVFIGHVIVSSSYHHRVFIVSSLCHHRVNVVLLSIMINWSILRADFALQFSIHTQNYIVYDHIRAQNTLRFCLPLLGTKILGLLWTNWSNHTGRNGSYRCGEHAIVDEFKSCKMHKMIRWH